MSNKSESGRPEENNHQKGVSKGQTEYLKKLAEGLKLNGKSRSQLSINKENPPPQEQTPPLRPDARNLTLGGGLFRSSSPANKQSVLVKRVFGKGKVISGMDSYRNKSELIDEDQGTLGSQIASNNGIENVRRDSNIVNFGPNEASDQRMRSTMYITGKGQKFALGTNRSGAPKTLIINLGEQTQIGFSPTHDHDMLIGVTEITTGATKIQQPANKNFSSKIKHKKDNRGRTSSMTEDSINNETMPQVTFDAKNQQKMRDFAIQNINSPIDRDIAEMQPRVTLTLNPTRGQFDDPMVISALAPARKGSNSPLGNQLESGEQKKMPQMKYGQQQIDLMIAANVAMKFYRPELTNIAVTNVDARSLIPSQSGREKSPIMRGKRFTQQEGEGNKKNRLQLTNKVLPKTSPKNDIKQFHKQQAQQYKDFIKKTNEIVGQVINQKNDQSQTTLMDVYLAEESPKIDNSVDLVLPYQNHQGTQPSDILTQSLEDQFNQFKQETKDSFFRDNSGLLHQIPTMIMTGQKKDSPSRLIETLRSGMSGPLIQNRHQIPLGLYQNNGTSANNTNENFKLSDRNSTINSKMLSTYRGADNMKLRIIDHSVLDEQKTQHNQGHQITTEDALNPIVESLSYEIAQKESARNSIIYDEPHLEDSEPHFQLISPFEQKIMKNSSPQSKIESFRALLKQESLQNKLRINSNQDSFRNLINPEVTRKEYTILGTSPSKKQFFIGNSQNQQLLTRKDVDMLHTVTQQFLQDNYPTTRQGGKGPIKASQRIAVDPSEFRAQLQKKIEELRRLEISESQIIRELVQSRESSEMTLAMGTVKEPKNRESVDATEDKNDLFMTYIHHGQNRTKADHLKQKLKLNRGLTKEFEKSSSDQLPPLISPKKKQVEIERFDSMATMRDEESERALIVGNYGQISRNRSLHQRGPFTQHTSNALSFGEMSHERRHEKSGITLASSGSANTIKRIGKRYQKEHRIVIFEDGAEIDAKTPCFQIELNQVLQKYYLQQNGQSQHTTQQQDINAQIKHYERAVKDILDQCGSRLFLDSEITPEERTRLNGAAPKRFNQLYSVYGSKIKSLIQIDEDTCLLIAGSKDTFKGLKTHSLFKNSETASNMLNRLVSQSPIRFDKKKIHQNFLPQGLGNSRNESPGKTFQLTQASQFDPIRGPSKSPKKRNYASQTSRDIIKATKKELIDQLTSHPRQMSLKEQLNKRSGSMSTMKAKRLALITMVTKGIKKGKLPPIETPKQLDVFVFGEQESKKTTQRDIIGPSSRIRKNMAISIADNTTDSALIPQLMPPNVNDLRTKRKTHFHLSSGQNLLDQMRQDGSVASLDAKSMIENNQIAEQELVSNDLHKIESLSLSLKKQQETVQSIQQIEQRTNSSANHTGSREPNPKDVLSSQNIKIARMALKERSPSYLNSKLVSQTSFQDHQTRIKMQSKMSREEEEQLKAEVNDHLLQNALQQRAIWRQQHQLDDRQLFKLFSEFSSMMQIHRMQENSKDPLSVKNQIQKLNSMVGIQSNDPMQALFPLNSNLSSFKYNRMQKEEQHKHFHLKKEDLTEFKVPVQVCIDYSEVLRPTKLKLRSVVLNAMGITTDFKGAKLSYDEFLKLNSFIKYDSGTVDDYIWFCVRLFDPQMSGFSQSADCEAIIDLLFDNQDEKGNTIKAPKIQMPKRIQQEGEQDDAISNPSYGERGADQQKEIVSSEKLLGENEDQANQNADNGIVNGLIPTASDSEGSRGKKAKENIQVQQEENDEGVASNIKKIFHDKGIFNKYKFLDPQALYQAFKDGLLNFEDFKAALK